MSIGDNNFHIGPVKPGNIHETKIQITSKKNFEKTFIPTNSRVLMACR